MRKMNEKGVNTGSEVTPRVVSTDEGEPLAEREPYHIPRVSVADVAKVKTKVKLLDMLKTDTIKEGIEDIYQRDFEKNEQARQKRRKKKDDQTTAVAANRITPIMMDKAPTTGNMMEQAPILVEKPKKKSNEKKLNQVDILDESPEDYENLSEEDFERINIDAVDARIKGREERGKWLEKKYKKYMDENNPFLEVDNEIPFILEEIDNLKAEKKSMKKDFKKYKADNKPSPKQFETYKKNTRKRNNERMKKAKKALRKEIKKEMKKANEEDKKELEAIKSEYL